MGKLLDVSTDGRVFAKNLNMNRHSAFTTASDRKISPEPISGFFRRLKPASVVASGMVRNAGIDRLKCAICSKDLNASP